MARLDRDGVAIHYEEHGHGPAILLSHGYSATCHMWDGQIAVLKDRYRVIAWDMRGHGQERLPDRRRRLLRGRHRGGHGRHTACLRRAARGDRRAVARRLHVAGLPPGAPRHDACADDLRHRPRLSQRRRTRGVEPACQATRGRTGCARLRGPRLERRGAHEPAPRCVGPGRRGARHADAARRRGDTVAGDDRGAEPGAGGLRGHGISSLPPITWRARSQARRRW